MVVIHCNISAAFVSTISYLKEILYKLAAVSVPMLILSFQLLRVGVLGQGMCII